MIRREFSLAAILAGAREPRQVFAAWNIAFLCAALLAFATKTSEDASRGFVILFYAGG